MTVGHNPTDRSKRGTKGHVLKSKKGISMSIDISSANTHDIKRPPPAHKTKKIGRKERRKLQHLYLDEAYNSEQEEQELIKRGYVLYIAQKRKRNETEKEEAKVIVQSCSNHKKTFCKKMGWRENNRLA